MAQENKALIKKVIQLWSKGNAEGIDEIYAPNCIIHERYHPSSPQTSKGIQAWKKMMSELREAFPDLQDSIEDQIAEGNKVVTRFTSRGTHKGNFFGFEPTHKKVTWTGISIDKIENGKIVETWINWDMYGLLEQIQAISIHVTR